MGARQTRWVIRPLKRKVMEVKRRYGSSTLLIEDSPISRGLIQSLDGTLTGLGGNLIIIDDPLKLGDAMSESVRTRVDIQRYLMHLLRAEGGGGGRFRRDILWRSLRNEGVFDDRRLRPAKLLDPARDRWETLTKVPARRRKNNTRERGSHQFIICCAQFGRDSLF